MKIEGCPYCGEKLDTEEAAAAGRCPSCLREYRACSSCGTKNRVLVPFCRACRVFRPIDSSWFQEGADGSRRNRRNLPRSYSGLSSVWSHPYNHNGSSGNGRAEIAGSVPSPILAGDMVVYYDPSEQSYSARVIFPSEDSAPVWSEPMRRRLSFSSSPIHFGAHMYFITPGDGFIHSIALDSGARQIRGLQLRGERPRERLPGELWEQCPPILFSCDDGGSRFRSNLLVLTSEGFTCLQLSNKEEPNRVFLPALHARNSWGGLRWNRPVILNGNLIATSAGPQPRLLTADLRALPDAFVPAIQKLPTNLDGFTQLSPCIALSKSDEPWEMDCIVFIATSPAQGGSRLVRFRPPDSFDAIEIPYVGEAGNDHNGAMTLHEQLPLSDGATLILPNANHGRRGFTVIAHDHYDARSTTHDLPFGHALFPCRGILAFAGRGELMLLEPHRGEPDRPRELTIKQYDKGNEFPISRPIAARGRLIVPCSKRIYCYEIEGPQLN